MSVDSRSPFFFSQHFPQKDLNPQSEKCESPPESPIGIPRSDRSPVIPSPNEPSNPLPLDTSSPPICLKSWPQPGGRHRSLLDSVRSRDSGCGGERKGVGEGGEEGKEVMLRRQGMGWERCVKSCCVWYGLDVGV